MIFFVGNSQSLNRDWTSELRLQGYATEKLATKDFYSYIRTASQSELEAVAAIVVCDPDFGKQFQIISRKIGEIPLIVFDDHMDRQKIKKLLRLGVDDVCSPDIDAEELILRIAMIRRRSHRDTCTSPNKMLISLDGNSPVYCGNRIELPRRQLRILEQLASGKGRRISKVQLHRAIYGFRDEEHSETLIESHVSRLRKTLREVLGTDPITCARHLGYRLDPDCFVIGAYYETQRAA